MLSPTTVSTQKLCQHEDRHGETLPFQKPSSAKSSPTSAKEREAQEIASDILAKLDNPEILDADQIAQLRAEVQRRVSDRELQRAEQAELDQLRLIVAMREAA